MFAVFGMTREYAKAQANKRVQTKVGKHVRTIEEYEQAKREFVEKLMAGKRVVKVSPPLSTPGIAQQWMNLAEKSGGVRLEVRIHHPHKEVVKNGITSIKRKWSRYIDGQNYQLIERKVKARA